MAHQTAGGNNAVHNFNNDFAHIEDPNERRRIALAEIEKAPFGWYHVRAILVAGTGFFTNNHDIFCVSVLTIMLDVDTAIKLSTSAGTVIGQVGFGALADIVGRKKMYLRYGLELILIIVATRVQALTGPGPGTSVVGVIIFWRVLMGIGIGGDCPLSSIITSEFATTKWRGAMMGMGIVPAALALYYRLTIPETSRYTFDVAHDVKQANADVQAYISGKKGEGHPDDIQAVAARRASVLNLEVPKASFADFFRFYGKLRNGKILFGTAMSWLLLDVAFRGLGLNSSPPNIYTKFYNLAAGNCILICACAMPGYWLAVFTIDIVGRKPLQLIGFVLLTILFIVWGFAYHKISAYGMLAIYIGSIITQGAIAPLRTRGYVKGMKDKSPWLNHVIQIFSAFMFASIFSTLLIPETMRRTLEDLA
ncbi:MFS general substrate transporter [Byssothecium circinans]|uniref:MFS general substrate transporter n=1 Tax=Byssothecium circinans TaxID=147558 RepID=A0A6A5U6W7_9PLEO|nr:MFS general substrate transporter [Byssothecium circinans]